MWKYHLEAKKLDAQVLDQKIFEIAIFSYLVQQFTLSVTAMKLNVSTYTSAIFFFSWP
jgi:hypothetical protein